jgi:hypothetical protein
VIDVACLADVKAALLTVTRDVSRYEAHQKKDKYIVWAEDSQGDSVWADGQMQDQAIQGTIDYFTKHENDPNVRKIQQALNDCGISFRLNSVQYEDETGYIHYEWVFEVEGW